MGGVAADKGMGKDAPTAADKLGEDFYKVLLQDEPFKSTTVSFTLPIGLFVETTLPPITIFTVCLD